MTIRWLSFASALSISFPIIAADKLPETGKQFPALASFDEDSLTLAVSASIDALGDRNSKDVAGIFFASTTPPYREKQAAATVATVLDTDKELRTMDFTDSLRAATSALLTALDLAKAGELLVVCAGDSRMGEPDTLQEQNYGDAGGAVVVGTISSGSARSRPGGMSSSSEEMT